jgi:VWFA-related protein
MHSNTSLPRSAISICSAALFVASQLWAAQPALSAAAGGRSPARKRTVLSVVVLDSLNTDWKSQLEARKAVRTMLQTLPPGNRVAIFALGDKLHMLHDFSSDPVPLLAAVNHYHGEQPFWWVDGDDSANSFLAAQYSSSESAPWGLGGPSTGASYNGPFYHGSGGFAQEQRILITFDAMTTIARIMRHASGQKYLLWVSSAFPLQWYPPEGVEAVRAMNRSRLALYAIDPRGVLQNFAAQDNIDTMKELAEATGGRTFYGNNNVASLLRVAVAVLSNEE